jgi:hypothetical protein
MSSPIIPSRAKDLAAVSMSATTLLADPVADRRTSATPVSSKKRLPRWHSLTPSVKHTRTEPAGSSTVTSGRLMSGLNLANVDDELCGRVATNLGMPAPTGNPAAGEQPSAALSQAPGSSGPISGRNVAVLVADGVDSLGVDKLRKALKAEGANLYVVGPRGGELAGEGGPVSVDRAVLTTQSVEYDALVVAGGASAAVVGKDPYTAVNLGEAYRHYKTVGAWGAGREVLEACGIGATAAGVVTGKSVTATFGKQLIEAIGWHRHWDRNRDGNA